MFLVIIILGLIFIGKIKSIIETVVLVLTLALAITKLSFLVPKYKPLPFCTTFIPSPVFANLIKSGGLIKQL